MIVVTGDKGLCGSFNTNVIKAAGTYIVEQRRASARSGWSAAKGATSSAAAASTCCSSRSASSRSCATRTRRRSRRRRSRRFSSGQVDRVVLVYNEFRRSCRSGSSSISCCRSRARGRGRPVGTAAPIGKLRRRRSTTSTSRRRSEIFNQLLPRYVEVQVYRALLESNAAFFAAQMTAMDTATKNSADMIGSLTLYMNKVRQAAITREIIEVVSGAAGAVADVRIMATANKQQVGQNRSGHRSGRRRRVRGRPPAGDLQRAAHPGGRPRRPRRDRRHRRGRAAPRREPRARGRDEADRRHAARHERRSISASRLRCRSARRRSAAC